MKNILIQFMNPGPAKKLILLGALFLLSGCCILPDVPGPIGIPGC